VALHGEFGGLRECAMEAIGGTHLSSALRSVPGSGRASTSPAVERAFQTIPVFHTDGQ
jgi:hypothetical protein